MNQEHDPRAAAIVARLLARHPELEPMGSITVHPPGSAYELTFRIVRVEDQQVLVIIVDLHDPALRHPDINLMGVGQRPLDAPDLERWIDNIVRWAASDRDCEGDAK